MFVLSTLLLAACTPKNPDDTGPTDPNPGDTADTDIPPPPDPNGFLNGELCLVRTVFEVSCVTGCHSAIVAGGGLDLQTDPYTAMVNRPAQRAGAGNLVTPGSKVDSFLYRKMANLIAATEGDVMPPGGTLDPYVVELVGNWIDRGASNDCDIRAPGGEPPPPPPPPPEPEEGPYHPPNWAQGANHGVAANLQTDGDCRSCHGSDLLGDGDAASCDQCHDAGWRTDCTLCHGGSLNASGAPPKDVDGQQNPNLISFPSHPAHIEVGYGCSQCHYTPTDYLTNGHVFGDVTPGYGEVDYSAGLSPVATYGNGQCSNTYCHGNGRGPNGTVAEGQGPLGCTSCHPNAGSVPVEWAQMSGRHNLHLQAGSACYECHGNTVDNTNSVIGPTYHVNGQPDLYSAQMTVGNSCDGTCHGHNHVGDTW